MNGRNGSNKSLLYTGLRNGGNWCFINALLQSYVRVHPDFAELILNPPTTNKHENFLKILSDLFEEMLNATDDIDYIDPQAFINLVIGSQYCRQQDVTDFNYYFVNILSEIFHDNKKFKELFFGTKYSRSGKDEKIELVGPGEFNLNVQLAANVTEGLKSSSKLITDIKTFKVTYELPKLLWINLNRFAYERDSVEKLNDQFFIENNLDLSFLCESPKDSDSQKSLESIDKDPELASGMQILNSFSQVMEFLNNNNEHFQAKGIIGSDLYGTCKILHDCGKILCKELEILKNNKINAVAAERKKVNAKFRLHSVIIHSGTPTSGHYYVYLKDENNIWYKCNDTSVSVTSFEEVQKDCNGGNYQATNAYSLLYVASSEPYVRSVHSSAKMGDN